MAKFVLNSAGELRQALTHELGDGDGKMVRVCSFSSISSQPLSFELFKNACYCMFISFQALRCSLKHDLEKNEYYLEDDVLFENIPIHEIFSAKKNDIWEIFESKLAEPLTTKKNLWAATLITINTNQCIIIEMHHSIGDGVSMILLLHRLLTACAEKTQASSLSLKNNLLLTSMVTTSSFPAAPYPALSLLPSGDSYETFTPINMRKPKVLRLSFAAAPLKIQSKIWGVTVNSILSAALIKAMLTLKNQYENSTAVIPLLTITNMRQYLSLGSDAFGSMINAIFSEWGPSDIRNFREFTLKVHQDMQEARKHQTAPLLMNADHTNTFFPFRIKLKLKVFFVAY